MPSEQTSLRINFLSERDSTLRLNVRHEGKLEYPQGGNIAGHAQNLSAFLEH
jgi:hypothetical protein